MQRNSEKRGIAFGAAIALISSLFRLGAASPALAATEGENLYVLPQYGTTTNLNGVNLEDFVVIAYPKPGASNNHDNFVSNKVGWEITRVSGDLDILVSTVSHTISALSTPASNSGWVGSEGGVPSISGTVKYNWTTASSFVGAVAGGTSSLAIRAWSSSLTATSSTVVVDITFFVENTATLNGVRDSLEWYTTERVTLHSVDAVTTTNTLASLKPGDTFVTASATINTLNLSQLSGTWWLEMNSNGAFTYAGASGTQTISNTVSSEVLAGRSGVLSQSFTVAHSGGVTESVSVSMAVRYGYAGGVGAIATGDFVGATTSAVTAVPGVTALSVSATAGDNISGSGTAYTVRPNETYTVRVHALTNSVSVSDKAVTVTVGGTGLVTSSKLLSINGGAFLTTYPAAGFTATTDADGYATFTLATSGFVEDDTLTIDANVSSIEASQVTLTVKNPTYLVEPDYEQFVTTPGAAVTIPVTVTDQWGKNSDRTDHYLKVTKGGSGFNYAATISYVAVSAGVVNYAFTPEGSTATGSATVTFDIVKWSNGAYLSDGLGEDVSVNVSSDANAFTTGLAGSYSASISYFPSTVSWTTITGKVANTGSAVAISGEGLIFRASSVLATTYSDGITVRANGSLDYTFDVASLLTGNHTITLTNGSNVTSSLLIVDVATFDSGKTITFDTSEVAAGKAKIVTGTVTDMNGNPVNTTAATGSASILVTYTGDAGAPVGTLPTETDADGKFRISIMTGANDSGTLTLTATYLKLGSATATEDLVTKVHAITVGSVSASASDAKVNAGSFKGYVAVYAKGYEGQRLSAKVGKDWVVVPSLASNFERVVEFTGAGYTIAVRIYIDRVLVDTITVTTK